ncbi:site-specific DNA-methyltransferase [Pectobacterium aroidearum]|uniref:DNA-methyltransferase n=1 Tax=Pectobacterium aroidearum TaxID=1201031 RepID=UPI002113FD61|nr:site-specific DNA-methyltransferase [Pectobacterium aroidearum]UUE38294.1 site-specific DNA-methyltransferase [Pectobacterium aroidearum]UUE42669.1 site-specific DNA-methyltransferase [Pectobacterium aroidearum]
MSTVKLHHGDCLDVLRSMPDNSVDSIVTDPPYGLKFMSKKWDYDVPDAEIWAECLRVLKPGGHLLAFAGTRTQHRMAVRIEDAGFEIRDMIAWVYGSGFPKSLDVSKAIDKAAGVERKIVGVRADFAARAGSSIRPNTANAGGYVNPYSQGQITAPVTDDAKQWNGWGTALKPALEPITVARKPFAGTVAANVLAHGTGALNIDECRIATDENLNGGAYSESERKNRFFKSLDAGVGEYHQPVGRWPANIIHNGSDDVVALFSDSKARFFYCAKASKKDRSEGNNHPTVKPTDLMAYLCRLVTPPSGTVLDPFMGSGSTGKAAALEGFNFIGIEREAEYVEIARARIADAQKKADAA